MVDSCRAAGITMFDTANSYNAGASERILGEIVAPFRADVLIASKVFNPTGDGSSYRGLRRPAIKEALEATLRRLGTDYLDLYYLHAPDRDTPIEETLGAMADAVAAGKVRQVGVSNYAAWQIAEIRCLSERHGWPTVSASQPMYNLLARRVEDEYAAGSVRYGLHNVVYNPLAGGLLSGKHTDPRRPQEGGRFASDLGPMYRERYWSDQQFGAVDALREIAGDAGLTLLELAFRWLLGRPLRRQHPARCLEHGPAVREPHGCLRAVSVARGAAGLRRGLDDAAGGGAALQPLAARLRADHTAVSRCPRSNRGRRRVE